MSSLSTRGWSGFTLPNPKAGVDTHGGIDICGTVSMSAGAKAIQKSRSADDGMASAVDLEEAASSAAGMTSTREGAGVA